MPKPLTTVDPTSAPGCAPDTAASENALAAMDLRRMPCGRLQLTDAQGHTHLGVVPVQAFPLLAPGEGVALVSPQGKELAWVDDLVALPEPLRALLQEELAQRDFMPHIQRIVRVSSFATPSVWAVHTDRGPTEFTLQTEDDIRRLAGHALLINSSQGVHYRVADMQALDKESRRLLGRFL